MIELRFHRTLYPGTLVDEALQVYEPYASLERSEEPSHWVIRVTAASESRARRIAGELGNYALGLVIRSGGAA